MKMEFTDNGVWFLLDDGKAITFVSNIFFEKIPKYQRHELEIAAKVEAKLKEVAK